jgi:hypothetical protein
MDWTDWHALEAAIPLDELPRFHRAFLEHHRPGEADWARAPLRQVQGKVQATLKRLQREGRARQGGDTLWVLREALPEAFRHRADPPAR